MRVPEPVRVKNLCFVGEQDGRPERMLKERLSQIFKRSGDVDIAYLAAANFGNKTEKSVVLCLRAAFNAQVKLVNEVSAVFSESFSTKEQLDIVFLNQELEAQLTGICQPFFLRKN